ncbi:helix-turn-helix domain-containing protein [Archangium minus]
MSAMKHFEQQSYYELLEVPVSASEDQILDAYARAMETYSPDSIAVYSLVEPEQLDALRQRLTQAMEVLCELELRIEYDRKIGITRSPEEVSRLRAESLKRAAESDGKEVPANGAGASPVLTVVAPVEPVAEVKPQELPVEQAQPVVQAQPVALAPSAAEAEPLDAVVVTEVEPESETAPVVEMKPRRPPEEPEEDAPVAMPDPKPELGSGGAVASVEAAAAEEPLPAPSVAATPVAAPPKPRSLTPMPGTLRSVAHARPSAPVARPGAPVPPPLPSRNGARPSPARMPNGQQLGDAPVLAQASAIATAESALAQVAVKARDSRTRLKTVVDIPSDAEFNGELLRRIREGRNISLQMLADRTRISARHVENIEADRYGILPAGVYLRGMLMSIARELGLDPLRVSRSYMGLVASGEKNRR